MRYNFPMDNAKGIGKIKRFFINEPAFAVLTAFFAVVFVFTAVICFGFDTDGGSVPSEPIPTEEATPSAAPETTPAASEAPAPTDAAEPTVPVYQKTTIIIDGTAVCTLSSREAAEQLLEDITAHFASIANAFDTEIANEVLLSAATAEEIISSDEAFELLTGEDTPLRVESRLAFTVTQTLPHEKETVEDRSILEGLRIIDKYGYDGSRTSAYERLYVNGEFVSEECTGVINEQLPVKTVIRMGKGSKRDFAAGKYSGKKGKSGGELEFSKPTEGSVEKWFGIGTDGEFNHGIDYKTEPNAGVYAAEGGTVVCVMERGAYGIVVEIEHENGFMTRYAGLSDADVTIGRTLEKGEFIGESGGLLHFELWIDFAAYNPVLYFA